MHYQLTGEPQGPSAHQASELERLVRYAAPTVTFVTVAGCYKPVRVRLALLTVPDRLAEPVLQGLRSLYGDEAAIQTSAAVRQRAEWRHAALLLPVDAGAPALDGRLLDGWDSACLTVQYAPGKAVATLVCCAEDAGRLARLEVPGWQRRDLPVLPPALAGLLRQGLARRWTGVPSLLPVPGAAPAPRPTPTPTATTTETAATTIEPTTDPLEAEARTALTEAEDGLILGVARDGTPVRLARRAQVLSVVGPSSALDSAVQALLLRAVQAGMAIVLAVPRSALPLALLSAWEERVRWLDVQRPQDSATLRWREVAPDLLAEALGVEPAQVLPPLPARFATLLDQLGASSLRLPALLTLTAAPGDDLRQVLAAGGLLLVPQDGDAASTLIARLVLAALATPPPLRCGLLLVLDPALVAPEALAAQALQVVLGPRADALLRLEADAAGWQLRTRGGQVLADVQAELMMDASGGRPDLIQAVLHALGAPEAPLEPAGHSEGPVEGEAAGALLDEEPLPWSTLLGEAGEGASEREAVSGEEPQGEDVVRGAEESVSEEEPVSADAGELPSARDAALDALLTALLELPAISEVEVQVRVLVANEEWGLADLAVRVWLAGQPEVARPWAWLAVMVPDDRERCEAAHQALARVPEPALAVALHAVLAALEAEQAEQGVEDPAEPDWVWPGRLATPETEPDLAEGDAPFELRIPAGVVPVQEGEERVVETLLKREEAGDPPIPPTDRVDEEQPLPAFWPELPTVRPLREPAPPWAAFVPAALGLPDVPTADTPLDGATGSAPEGLGDLGAASVDRVGEEWLLPPWVSGASAPPTEPLFWERPSPLAPLTEPGLDETFHEEGEKPGDPVAAPLDPVDTVEPILGFPVWDQRDPAAPWTDPAGPASEPPAPSTPVEPAEPSFWAAPSSLAPLPAPGLHEAACLDVQDREADDALHAGAIWIVPEVVGEPVTAPLDRVGAVEPILALPLWEPQATAAPWADPAGLASEPPVEIAPVEPLFWDMSSPLAPLPVPSLHEAARPDVQDREADDAPHTGAIWTTSEEPTDPVAAPLERVDEKEPILGFPVWDQHDLAAPWTDPAGLATEPPVGRTPADPGFDDTPGTAAAPGLDDAALVRAWQVGATSAELVAQLVAAGVERAEARLRVRQVLRGGAEMPFTPSLLLPAPAPVAGEPLRPLASQGAERVATQPDPDQEQPDPRLALPTLDLALPDPREEAGEPDPAAPTLAVPASELAVEHGEELLTPSGVAALLGCQDGYVRKLISRGALPATKDARGVNRVSRAAVLAYQQQQAERR